VPSVILLITNVKPANAAPPMRPVLTKQSVNHRANQLVQVRAVIGTSLFHSVS